jgi:glycolate oxidase subunit GlcD
MDKLIHRLREIVGKSNVSVSQAHAELYSYDASLAKGKPDLVVFPGDANETARVIACVNAAGMPFVPRGFGTNLSGGTVMPEGGAVICLSRLNRILDIVPQGRYAIVQPGVTNLELQDALAPLGFFYAPDPASQKVATIGGNAGENSGGPRCLKYGVTTNHILGLEVVLASGEIMRFGGPSLDPPGYDLRGIMIGSEGTLGIVTEVTVRIIPLAEKIITMLAIYNDIADAAHSVSDIISAGIVPTTLEMMDSKIIQAVEDSYACGYPRDAAAVLIIEVEGPPAGLREQAEQIRQLCLNNNCREINEAKDNDERNRLWEGRRGAFGAVARLAPNYLVNDCTVPRTKLPAALAKVSEITNKYKFEHGNVFHAGDGNLHPLILFDSRNTEHLHQVEKAGWEIMQACVNLEGTISGEHGIGLEKLNAMHMIFSDDDLSSQHALQIAFDSEKKLNPGKAIPRSKKSDLAAELQEFNPVAASHSPVGNEKKLQENILQAISQNQSVFPSGNGTSSDFGNVSETATIPLPSAELCEILEYDPPNQVITVGAGTTLETLQKELAAHNQWFPVRPPLRLQQHSLGGIVALGASGPERMLYGAPRDLLLGLRFINGSGKIISTGGKVVKNVAGYDMTRLLTGTAGTLGFITAVTCRVATIPEQCAAGTALGTLQDCLAAASAVIQSSLTPAFAALVPKNHADKNPNQTEWEVAIGFEGFKATIEYQLEKCGDLLRQENLKNIERIDYALHDGLFAGTYAKIADSAYIMRAGLPLTQISDFLGTLNGEVGTPDLLLDVGCGRIYAGFENLTDTRWQRHCELAESLNGHVILEKAPDDFKRRNDVFGRPRSEWKMTHRVKAVLDPKNIFNPGRLPGKK